MKLIYLMRFWPVFGGGETVTRTLVNEMCKRSHQVSVVYLWERDNGTNVFVDSRVDEYQIEGMTNRNDGGILKSEYAILRDRLRKIFLKVRPDIVIDQWLPTKLVAEALDGWGHSVLVKCHHGSIRYTPVIQTWKQKLFYGLGGELARWVRVFPELYQDYRFSEKWVLLSEGTKKEARTLIPWCKEPKLYVIPNPLPYEVEADEVKLEKKNKDVLFVGRIVFLKKLPYIIKAWSLIEDKVPEWTLRIVGDGDAMDEAKQTAENENVKNVVFEGFKDSRQFFLNAPIVVMASAIEGFGMVLVEAQQNGCVPVVVDSFVTVHDIIEHNVNGVLVEEGNIEKYAGEIMSLIKDDARRRRLALQAMNDSKRFLVKEICDRWEEFFAELINEKGKK